MFLRTKLKFSVVTCSVFLICILKSSSALDWRVFEGQDLRYEVHTSLVKLEAHGPTESYCSGSIISNKWIISSAHCKNPGTVSMTVLHGSRSGLKSIATVLKDDIIVHPDYISKLDTPQNRGNDMALLHIRRPLQFDPNVNSISLATFDPPVGATGIIAGYGYTEPYLKAPREAPIVITQCPPGGNIICTRGSVRAGHGDSGGPLIYNGRIVGITSSTCSDAPTNRMCVTKYASVAANMKWIITNIVS